MRTSSVVAALLALAAVAPAGAAVNVMTSTEDLADLTRQVGARKRAVEPQRLDHDAAVMRAGAFLVGAAFGTDRADVVHGRFPS